MPWILFGVCLLVGLYLVGRWYVSARPGDILLAIRWTAGTIVVAGVIFIALTGRWNLLWVLSIPAFPLIAR